MKGFAYTYGPPPKRLSSSWKPMAFTKKEKKNVKIEIKKEWRH